MNCPQCGSPRSQEDAFCQKCGAPAQPTRAAIASQGEPTAVAVGSPAQLTKRCPFCGEEILQAAIKCRFCSSDLTAPAGSLQARGGSNVIVNAPPMPAAGAMAMPSIVIQNVQTQQSAPRGIVPGQYKNPGVALLLSIIFPGGGQFYNGQAGKGILVLFTFWIFGITYIWSLFDAYSSAQRINRVGF
jgi:hypothetical protein